MKPERKLVAVAVGSFVSGVFVAGVAGYVAFDRYVENGFVSSFYANAVHAQFEVRTLGRLRAGDTDKVMRDLDLMLDSHTMQLAEYETVVAAAHREQFVYRTMREVREYRANFPTTFEFPLQQAEFQKALDLGKKGGG